MKFITLSNIGIHFLDQGDEVAWIWPWKRSQQNYGWLSIGFEDTFRSLKEIRELWTEYVEATNETLQRKS